MSTPRGGDVDDDALQIPVEDQLEAAFGLLSEANRGRSLALGGVRLLTRERDEMRDRARVAEAEVERLKRVVASMQPSQNGENGAAVPAAVAPMPQSPQR